MRRPLFLQLTPKTFTRFLLAYLLFFLCLAGMLVPIYRNVNRLYQQAIERENLARLESGVEALSQEIQRMEASRYSFQSSLVFRTLSAKSKPLSPRDVYQLEVMRRELQQAVDHYALTGDVVMEVGILFHNDLAVTRNRSFPSVDQYYGSFLRCEELTQRQWLAGLAAAAENAFILPERSYLSYDRGSFQGLMIALPLQTVYRESSLHLLFYLLDANALLEGMATPEVLRAGAVTLYDSEGAVLARCGQALGAGVELRQASGQAGLVVSLFVPYRLVAERMAPLRQVFLVGLGLYVLVGVLLMGFLAWHNNRPVYRLVSSLRECGQPVEAARTNGYEAIDASIRRMGTDLANAQQALAEQERALRAGLMARLIHGLIDSQDDWSQAIGLFDPFPEDYCVAYIQHDADARGAARMAVMQRLRERLGAAVSLHVVESACVLALLPIAPPHQTAPEDYEPLLREVMALVDQDGVHTVLGVSAVFSSIQTFHIACRQARHLLRLCGDGARLSLYANVDEKNIGLPMQFTDSQQLCSLLCAGDETNALLLLDNAFQRIKRRGLIDESYLQHAFIGFVQVLDRAYYELGQSSAVPPSLPPLPAYSPTESLSDLLEEIRSACRALCAHVQAERQAQAADQLSALLRFLRENLADPDLYAPNVAQRFGLAERSLHRMMREGTGKSFFEFLEDLRMEQAHTLLIQSDLPIADIARQCGFALSNSFYKAFKRRYGFAPSALRRGDAPQELAAGPDGGSP